jgi:hypothetical protein
VGFAGRGARAPGAAQRAAAPAPAGRAAAAAATAGGGRGGHPDPPSPRGRGSPRPVRHCRGPGGGGAPLPGDPPLISVPTLLPRCRTQKNRSSPALSRAPNPAMAAGGKGFRTWPAAGGRGRRGWRCGVVGTGDSGARGAGCGQKGAARRRAGRRRQATPDGTRRSSPPGPPRGGRAPLDTLPCRARNRLHRQAVDRSHREVAPALWQRPAGAPGTHPGEPDRPPLPLPPRAHVASYRAHSGAPTGGGRVAAAA